MPPNKLKMLLIFIFSMMVILVLTPADHVTLHGSEINHENPTILGPDTIIKNSEFILPSSFFMEYFTAVDIDNNDITHRITIHQNNYAGNANRPGKYEVTLKVEDENENISLRSFDIIVSKDIDPYLIVDDSHFVLSPRINMTSERLINNLKSIDQLANKTYIIDVLFDNYSANKETIGNYSKSFYLLSETGEDYYFYLTFEVIEPDTNFIEASTSFFTSFLSFIKSWWWTITIPLGLIAIGLIKK